MLRFAYDICRLGHKMLDVCLPDGGEVALDATLGRGADTAFLLERFKRVYAFDIQASAIEAGRALNNDRLTLVHDSHDKLTEHIDEPLDCAMFNLGYLPRADKDVHTTPATTIPALKQTMALLRPGGFMAVTVYRGHEMGVIEAAAVDAFLSELSAKQFGVVRHQFANKSDTAPYLLLVEKTQKPPKP